MTLPAHTSLADQDLSDLGGRLSVLHRQRADHVRLDELLTALDGAGPEEEQEVLRALYRLVFPHAFAEETVLWPVLRRVLPDGEELTHEVEQEHQEVNELVGRLEELAPGDPGRAPLRHRLAEVLREDVRDEEDELLPRLQAAVPVATLRRLGLAWEVVRRVSPTRAHPVVARRPPGNVLAALPLTVLDRTRDRLEAMIGRARPGLVGPLRGADAVLRSAARRVERLPLMSAGEHPSTRSPASAVRAVPGT